MRKQIIKFFALDYKVFVFGRLVSWTRSANIIFPLMIFLPISFNNGILEWVNYCLLAMALFFGFVYFRIKPLQESDYDYFDQVQRFIWDYKNGKNTEPLKKHNNIWAFWVNPIAALLVVLFLLL